MTWLCLSADLGFRDSDAKGENASVVALPPGNWYKLNTTTTVKGDAVLQETLAITEFPVRRAHRVFFTRGQVTCFVRPQVYVRPGAILTLNKEKVQYSGAQGGALEVQVRHF